MRKLWKSVRWFADQMQYKLNINRHKNHWSECTYSYLIERLKEEVNELSVHVDSSDVFNPENKQMIIKECADVANFAMIIADSVNDRSYGGKDKP